MVGSKKVFGNDGQDVEKPTLQLNVSAPFLDVDGGEAYQASITLAHPDGGEITSTESWMLEAVYHAKDQLDKLAKLFEMALVKQAITRGQQIRYARHRSKPEDLINAAAKESLEKNKKEA